MLTLERYLKHEHVYVALMLFTYLFTNNTINATSIIMEARRSGGLERWTDPFVTEYTSAVAFFLLFPTVLWMVRRFPLEWGRLRRNTLCHVGFSLLFCVAHVALFVALRRLIFAWQGLDYRFTDDWLISFVYEYRKDAWAYLFMVVCIYTYQFVLSRLRGEAVALDNAEDSRPDEAPERFLVRKLGKEFVVRADEVEWLEAAGNYVNLHVGDRTYPLRSTMVGLIDALDGRGFVRIHRSRGVNMDFVESITPLDSGDCTVTLKGGKTLNLSRRYRDALRQQLHH